MNRIALAVSLLAVGAPAAADEPTPVVATTESDCVGSSKKAAAIWPVAAFMDVSVATRASSKPKSATPASSTRQVAAPAASAAPTKRRPSFA